MKPREITGLITQQAAATKLNLKGFIGESGICFSTFRRMQTCDGEQSMVKSVAAFLKLMDIAQVSHPDRYVELDLSGEQVVVIRREDFLAMKVQPGSGVMDNGRKEKPAVKSTASTKVKAEPAEIRAAPPVVGAKKTGKGRRAIPRTGRCCSRGRSNRR